MLHKEYWKMSITIEFLAKISIEKLPYILIEVILSSISIIKHLLRYKFQIYLGYSRPLCWGLFGLFRPQNEPFLIIENDKKVFPCRVIHIKAIKNSLEHEVAGGNGLPREETGCLGRQPVVWGGTYRDLSGSNRRPAASLASGGNYSDLSATSLAYLLLPNLTYLMTASWKSVLLLFWLHLNWDSSQYFYSLGSNAEQNTPCWQQYQIIYKLANVNRIGCWILFLQAMKPRLMQSTSPCVIYFVMHKITSTK